jgi:hypothetical protein
MVSLKLRLRIALDNGYHWKYLSQLQLVSHLDVTSVAGSTIIRCQLTTVRQKGRPRGSRKPSPRGLTRGQRDQMLPVSQWKAVFLWMIFLGALRKMNCKFLHALQDEKVAVRCYLYFAIIHFALLSYSVDLGQFANVLCHRHMLYSLYPVTKIYDVVSKFNGRPCGIFSL